MRAVHADDDARMCFAVAIFGSDIRFFGEIDGYCALIDGKRNFDVVENEISSEQRVGRSEYAKNFPATAFGDGRKVFFGDNEGVVPFAEDETVRNHFAFEFGFAEIISVGYVCEPHSAEIGGCAHHVNIHDVVISRKIGIGNEFAVIVIFARLPHQSYRIRQERAVRVVAHVEHFIAVSVERERNLIARFVGFFALENKPSGNHRSCGITRISVTGVTVVAQNFDRSVGERLTESQIAYLSYVVTRHGDGVVRSVYGGHPDVEGTAAYRRLLHAQQYVDFSCVIYVIDAHAHHIPSGMMLRGGNDRNFFAPLRIRAHVVGIAVCVESVYLTETEYVKQAVYGYEGAVLLVTGIIIGGLDISVSICKYVAVSASAEAVGLIEPCVLLDSIGNEYFQFSLINYQRFRLNVAGIIAFRAVYRESDIITARRGGKRHGIFGIGGAYGFIFRYHGHVVDIHSVVTFENVNRRNNRFFVSVVIISERTALRFHVRHRVVDVYGNFYRLRSEILRGEGTLFQSVSGEYAERIAHFVHEFIEESVVIRGYLIGGEFVHVYRRESDGYLIIFDNVVQHVIGGAGRGRSDAVFAPDAERGLVENPSEDILRAVKYAACGIFAVNFKFVEAVAVSKLVLRKSVDNAGRSLFDRESGEKLSVIIGASGSVDLRVEEIISRVFEARITHRACVVPYHRIAREFQVGIVHGGRRIAVRLIDVLSRHERHRTVNIRQKRLVACKVVANAFHFHIAAGGYLVFAVHDLVVSVKVIGKLFIILHGDVRSHADIGVRIVGEIDFEAVVVEGYRNGISPSIRGEREVGFEKFYFHSAVEIHHDRSLRVAVEIPDGVIHAESDVVNAVSPAVENVRRVLHRNTVADRISYEAVIIGSRLIHNDAHGNVGVAQHVDEVSVRVAGGDVGARGAVAVRIVVFRAEHVNHCEGIETARTGNVSRARVREIGSRRTRGPIRFNGVIDRAFRDVARRIHRVKHEAVFAGVVEGERRFAGSAQTRIVNAEGLPSRGIRNSAH